MKFIEWLILKEGDASIINVQQVLQGKQPEWIQIVSRFPEMLQKEILEERPNPNQEDIQWISSWQLASKQPVAMNTTTLLQNKENLEAISRTPHDIIQEINKKWGLNVPAGKVYDPNPDRYQQYKQFQGSTAKPSVMVNGVIEFGVGRFIAALLRGDKQLIAWDIRSKK